MIEHFKLKCFFSYNGSMKILFLDIDGTVLSHTTNTIPSSALKAINTVRKQGIKVFGCTGRHTLELEKLPLEHLEVDGWITMNGAYNYTESCVISSYPIEKQDIHALYDFLKKESFPVQFLEAKYMLLKKVWKRFILSKIHLHHLKEFLKIISICLFHGSNRKSMIRFLLKM